MHGFSSDGSLVATLAERDLATGLCCFQEPAGHGSGNLFDGFGHYVSEVALDTEIFYKHRVDETLVLVDASCDNVYYVVDAAASSITVAHFGSVKHTGFETLHILGRMSRKRDFDNDEADI